MSSGESHADQNAQHDDAKRHQEIPKTPGAAEKKKPEHPATLTQKIVLSAYLLMLTSISVWYTYSTIDRVNVDALVEISTPWELPQGFALNGAPNSFRYDAVGKRLLYRGALTADLALQLRDLLAIQSTTPPASLQSAPATRTAQGGPEGKQAASGEPHGVEVKPSTVSSASLAKLEDAHKSYNAAIDRLVYLSSANQGSIIQLLLLLGLFGGMLGATLRSLVDFVGNACYTEQLDLVVWWPLYLTRPVVGGILGFVLVVLFKAKLVAAGDTQPGDDSFWWLGIAMIGGFSTVDVTLRLRLAAKALFGVDSGDKGPKGDG